MVELLREKDVSSHQYDQIALGILQMMSAHGSIVIQRVPREANSLADYLAKVGFSLPLGLHTFESSFGECQSLLQRDLLCPLSPPGGSVAR